MTQRSPFQRFLRELRRRRVPQTAAIYLVAAWAAIEFADVVVPNLNGPGWVVTAVIVAAFVGLPGVLVLAWFFDWGTEGVTRTRSEGEPGDETGLEAPWVAALAVLVVAIGSAVAVAALLTAGGGGEADSAAAGDVEAEADAVETPGRPGSPPGIRAPLEDLEEQILSSIPDLDRLRLDTLDPRGLSDLAAMSRGTAVTILQPEQWLLARGGLELEEGESVEVNGLARDTAGVRAVYVDGSLVEELDEPREVLRFSVTLTGTGRAGVRMVPIRVVTADGREIERSYRVVQLPPGSP